MTLRNCNGCGKRYEAVRSTSKYCSSGCRARVSKRGPLPSSALESPPPVRSAGGVFAATSAVLEAAERAETPLGAAALALARRVDHGDGEQGSAFAALVREHRAALAEALRGAQQAASPLDEVKARRDRKLAG